MNGLRLALGGAGCAVLACAAALHVFWGLGGRTPMLATLPEVGGRAAFHSSRAATLAVALALMMACLVLALRVLGVRIRPVPDQVAVAISWLLAAVFALRAVGDFRLLGFFKQVVGSRFAAMDTWIYSPVCVLLALAFAVAAMPGR